MLLYLNFGRLRLLLKKKDLKVPKTAMVLQKTIKNNSMKYYIPSLSLVSSSCVNGFSSCKGSDLNIKYCSLIWFIHMLNGPSMYRVFLVSCSAINSLCSSFW